MKSIVIQDEAIAELESAIAYYEERQVGLGLDFLAEVEQAIRNIQRNPNVSAPYGTLGIRRYVMRRFPFVIFYSELTDIIWIIAIAHAKRKPGYWQRRQLE